MNVSNTRGRMIAGTLLLLAVILLAPARPVDAATDDPKLASDRCRRCQGREGFSREGPDGVERDLHVSADMFHSSVHGDRECIECHQDITKTPHRKGVVRKVGCVTCHLEEWGKVQADQASAANGNLENVVEHIESYMDSLHARPRIDDQSRTNATCHDCHGSHYIQSVDRVARSENYLNLPNMCGTCHAEELEHYKTSVHGQEWVAGNKAAAICADCHSRHGVGEVGDETARVEVTENCGSCHQDSLETYLHTYHGKITRLGYGDTAKCFDCHGAHDIQDPHEKSMMVSRSCGTCHEDVYDKYHRSVHGAALSADNRDVPACADCHTAHVVAHPDTLRFLAGAAGFTDVRIELRSPVPPDARLQPVPAEGLPERAASIVGSAARTRYIAPKTWIAYMRWMAWSSMWRMGGSRRFTASSKPSSRASRLARIELR